MPTQSRHALVWGSLALCEMASRDSYEASRQDKVRESRGFAWHVLRRVNTEEPRIDNGKVAETGQLVKARTASLTAWLWRVGAWNEGPEAIGDWRVSSWRTRGPA